jgi:hypothetical protein
MAGGHLAHFHTPDMTIANDPVAPFHLVLVPDKPALPAGQPHTLRLLLRVQAPDAPAGAHRGPLHLALVLDRSTTRSNASHR